MAAGVEWFFIDPEGDVNGPITSEQARVLPLDIFVCNSKDIKEWTQLRTLIDDNDDNDVEYEYEDDLENMYDDSIKEEGHHHKKMTLADLTRLAQDRDDDDIIDEELSDEPIDESLEDDYAPFDAPINEPLQSYHILISEMDLHQNEEQNTDNNTPQTDDIIPENKEVKPPKPAVVAQNYVLPPNNANIIPQNAQNKENRYRNAPKQKNAQMQIQITPPIEKKVARKIPQKPPKNGNYRRIAQNRQKKAQQNAKISKYIKNNIASHNKKNNSANIAADKKDIDDNMQNTNDFSDISSSDDDKKENKESVESIGQKDIDAFTKNISYHRKRKELLVSRSDLLPNEQKQARDAAATKSKKAKQAAKKQEAAEKDYIECELCTFHNDINATECVMCWSRFSPQQMKKVQKIIKNQSKRKQTEKEVSKKSVNSKKRKAIKTAKEKESETQKAEKKERRIKAVNNEQKVMQMTANIDEQLEDLMQHLKLSTKARKSARKLSQKKKIDMLNSYKEYQKIRSNYKKSEPKQVQTKTKTKNPPKSKAKEPNYNRAKSAKVSTKTMPKLPKYKSRARSTEVQNKNNSKSYVPPKPMPELQICEAYIKRYGAPAKTATHIMKFSKADARYKALSFREASKAFNEFKKQNRKTSKEQKAQAKIDKKTQSKMDKKAQIKAKKERNKKSSLSGLWRKKNKKSPKAAKKSPKSSKKVPKSAKKAGKQKEQLPYNKYKRGNSTFVPPPFSPSAVRRTQKAAVQNDVDDDVDDDTLSASYNKRQILKGYNANRSAINEPTDQSVRNLQLGLVQKAPSRYRSFFDESSSDEDDDRLTVNIKQAKHTQDQVSSHFAVKL